MLKERELRYVLADSGAKAIISLQDLWNSVGARAVAGTGVTVTIATSPLDYLDQKPPPLLAGVARMSAPGAADLGELVREHAGLRPAPVDPASGALSVGVPVFNTVVRILDDAGNELPPGEVGEIATSGPMVVPGYWNRPDATARTLPGGELRTGDVGAARPYRRMSASGRAPPRPRRSSSSSAARSSPPTSTRGAWRSSPTCRRRPPESCSAASCATAPASGG